MPKLTEQRIRELAGLPLKEEDSEYVLGKRWYDNHTKDIQESEIKGFIKFWINKTVVSIENIIKAVLTCYKRGSASGVADTEDHAHYVEECLRIIRYAKSLGYDNPTLDEIWSKIQKSFQALLKHD